MMSAPSFVSESEIVEKRRRRQEEWEKVRTEDQPLEAPEESYDHRSLYERLQEQKEKKQLEFEETHRLRNMVKGLEDDEVEFLDLIDRTREKMDKALKKEEDEVLKDYREQVIEVVEEEKPKAAGVVKEKVANPKPKALNQRELLKGAVKRKSSETSEENLSPKKAKPDNTGEAYQPVLNVAGVLPGIGEYTDSSDSESSSSDPESYLTPHCDLLGRKIKFKLPHFAKS